MHKLVVNGGQKLSGEVEISGAKNAALPLLAASLLSDEEVVFTNMPHHSDVKTMFELLEELGADIDRSEFLSLKKISVRTKAIKNTLAPYEIVSRMRASVIVLGALLSREGKAEISLPGGCAIGTRPINYHLDAFEKMGAKITLEEGYIKAEGKLKGAEINFPIASVGATQNVMIAATLADGLTTIYNAAKEPEIEDLAILLNSMGANIIGAGTAKIEITGTKKLEPCKHKVIPDRIEAGSYLIAGLATGGNIIAKGIRPEYLESTLVALESMGVLIERNEDDIRVFSPDELLPSNVVTRVFPGFPTDMQAQITALMCLSHGTSSLEESIFENRFMHIPELCRMGANIKIDGKKITISGITNFKPAKVMATDLRASFSLVIAALNANGESTINRLYHLDRGYEDIEEKLSKLGAKVHRIKDN